MIDLKLTDVFSTLCIGTLSFSLITYFYFIINKFFVPEKFNEEEFFKWIKEILANNYKESGYMVLGLVLIYSLGVIFGDLTGRMTDSDSSHKGWLLKSLKTVSGIHSQELARRDALVKHDKGWELTPLGTAILRSTKIVENANYVTGTNFFSDTSKTFDENWKQLNLKLVTDSAEITQRGFSRFVQQIYYTGKNWAFSKEGEPLNELKAIQNKIDLARSTVLLLTFGILFLLLIVVSNIIIAAIRVLKKKDPVFTDLVILLQPIAFLVMLLLAYLSRDCYSINEDNYNKRAYGYYVSEVNRIEFLGKIEHLDADDSKVEE